MPTLLFGVIDPCAGLPDRLRGPRYAQLDALCAAAQQRHLPLVWHDEALVTVSPTPAPVDCVGITITALDDALGDPVADLIDLRQLRGLTQAMVDWQVVRLLARAFGIELDNGQLFLVYEDGGRWPEMSAPLLTRAELLALLNQPITRSGQSDIPLGPLSSCQDAAAALRALRDGIEEAYHDDFLGPDDESGADERQRLRALCLAIDLLTLLGQRS